MTIAREIVMLQSPNQYCFLIYQNVEQRTMQVFQTMNPEHKVMYQYWGFSTAYTSHKYLGVALASPRNCSDTFVAAAMTADKLLSILLSVFRQ